MTTNCKAKLCMTILREAITSIILSPRVFPKLRYWSSLSLFSVPIFGSRVWQPRRLEYLPSQITCSRTHSLGNLSGFGHHTAAHHTSALISQRDPARHILTTIHAWFLEHSGKSDKRAMPSTRITVLISGRQSIPCSNIATKLKDCSGNGTNLQAIMDACRNETIPNASVARVIR